MSTAFASIVSIGGVCLALTWLTLSRARARGAANRVQHKTGKLIKGDPDGGGVGAQLSTQVSKPACCQPSKEKAKKKVEQADLDRSTLSPGEQNLGLPASEPALTEAVTTACAQIAAGEEYCIEIEAEPLTDADATALGNSLKKNTTVNELNIYGKSALSDAGIKAICRGLKKKTRVTSLTIEDSLIGDHGASDLARALVSTMIAEVDVSFGGRIGDVGAKEFSSELPFTKVRHLSLQKGTIGYDGTVALAEKLPETKITSFILSEQNVGDTGAAALAYCLGNCEQLLVLGLQNNGIRDAGVTALAEALPGSQLTDLYLRGNDIGDAGAKALAEHLHKSSITKLDLKENPRITVRFTTKNADGSQVQIWW